MITFIKHQHQLFSQTKIFEFKIQIFLNYIENKQGTNFYLRTNYKFSKKPKI